jgi:hypothetical protein
MVMAGEEPKPEISETAIVIEVNPGDTADELSNAMTGALTELMSAEAIEFSCHVAYLSRNGSGYIARFTGDGSVAFLAKHEEPQGFALPIARASYGQGRATPLGSSCGKGLSGPELERGAPDASDLQVGTRSG